MAVRGGWVQTGEQPSSSSTLRMSCTDAEAMRATWALRGVALRRVARAAQAAWGGHPRARMRRRRLCSRRWQNRERTQVPQLLPFTLYLEL